MGGSRREQLTKSSSIILLLVLQAVKGRCMVYSDSEAGGKSFYIANDTFYKDESPFRILGGEIHYFRVHPQYWEDRLLRAKSLGVNVIQTYVPWNLHQPQPDHFSFEEGSNLEGYLKLIQKQGLLAMLRIGPYICAEWDFGGFPAWLLSVRPELRLRTSDPQYLELVYTWWDVLLPKIVPYLYRQHGPVIMVQVENEYGSFGDDKSYMKNLVSKVRAHLGDDVLLYTTDGAVLENLEHGTLKGNDVYTAVDFPTEWDPAAAFALQKQFNVPGKSPSLSSEFYTGWLTHWGELPSYTDPKFTAAALDRILRLNASVVLYMLHGGTNFGFTSGSNTGESAHDFSPDITSYDYDAPIGEAGDVDNHKYRGGYGSHFSVQDNKLAGAACAPLRASLDTALKAIVARYSQEPLPEPPPLPARKAFGSLQLEKWSSLFHILGSVSTVPGGVQMDQPRPMETLHQISGFVLYRTTLPSRTKAGSKLSISQVRDRAQVFISAADKEHESILGRYMHIGTLERWSTDTLWLPSSAGVPGLQLDILVENMGRVNYGPYLYDSKGIASGVLLDDMPILDWVSFSIPLDSTFPTIAGLASKQRPQRSLTTEYDRDAGNWTDGPSFYLGQLSVDSPADTFLSLAGWSKGVAFLNGFNLGRYWPVKGPQCTLYVPSPLLHAGVNELILLELEKPDDRLRVNFSHVADYSCKKGSRGL